MTITHTINLKNKTMKKTVLFTMVALATASLFVAGYQTYSNLTNSAVAPLLHENIEALSSGNDLPDGIKCTGPKTLVGKVCKCENEMPCMDNHGCKY